MIYFIIYIIFGIILWRFFYESIKLDQLILNYTIFMKIENYILSILLGIVWPIALSCAIHWDGLIIFFTEPFKKDYNKWYNFFAKLDPKLKSPENKKLMNKTCIKMLLKSYIPFGIGGKI